MNVGMGGQNLVCGELEALRVKNRELKILFAAGTVERIILILSLIHIFLSCISNKYLTVNNLINIVRQESTLIIIACAATMLMISGGMDLSPAGVIALTSVVFAKLCVSGISIPLAALLSLFVGIAAGAFSGLLVVMANVPPMIATLGTWYITCLLYTSRCV